MNTERILPPSPEPPIGTWARDRFGAVTYRQEGGGWGEPGIMPLGKWERMYEARGPYVETGPWGKPLGDESEIDDADLINHPAHYTRFPVEVIELTEHMTFLKGNVVKYVVRAGIKSPETELEDLLKAKWYLEREIANVQKLRG